MERRGEKTLSEDSECRLREDSDRVLLMPGIVIDEYPLERSPDMRLVRIGTDGHSETLSETDPIRVFFDSTVPDSHRAKDAVTILSLLSLLLFFFFFFFRLIGCIEILNVNC